MKNFKKVLLAGAAIAAMTAAVATSAMAADDFDAKYADGKITLSGVPAACTAQDQVTMVVISGQDDVNPTSENLKQIGQEAGADSVFATIPVGTLADGDYIVKLGGTDGNIYSDTFTVGDPVKPTGLLGDVDGKNGIEIVDATMIVKYVLGSGELTADEQNRADVDQKNGVEIIDAKAIVKHVLGTGEITGTV